MRKFVKFAELPVADQDRAVRFYTEKLGFRVAQDSPYKDRWRWIELEIPGADTRILLAERRADYEPNVPRLVFVADDVEKAYEHLIEKGIHFTKAPTQAPWASDEMFAQFQDSEGNEVVVGSR